MILYVKDFTKFPGARYRNLGPSSGEEYRDDILLPAIHTHGSDLVVDLDGVFGYGSSFLEEIFGGCIRKGVSPDVMNSIVDNIISKDDEDLVDEIREYVKDAIRAR
ncbi:STAS-like domain-containing protein [Vibrio parahaemolyticus]|uniref:STAS-like domain-containing protein n=1 Tax=Vibrio parahaemolyticus TaxID=670 RepID=UPI00047222CD|nr:STAS-like domain-containing protein [Vibrio parahaemolyticus]MDG2669016.1 STAS-like domain-containing protein [Vibrio parahaemolyticus]MDG2789883.1 STAS-like domain-containing protein [Vibrio parahaemolyticus]HCZ9539444.1 STAS-like domain-containing protein [Vibrio alginolyticus]